MEASNPVTRLRRTDLSGAGPRSGRRRLYRTFIRNRTAVVGLALAVLITLLVIGAPAIARRSPLEQSARDRLSPPDRNFVMGRDTFGRDVFSRLLHAGRISLTIGAGSVLLGATIGTVMGLVAGYQGGRVENAIMRLIDLLMVFPSLLLGLTILAVLGPGLSKMILTIGILLSPTFARVVHGSVLTLKEREFVEAARSIGAGAGRILFVHVLPNVSGEIIVLASLLTASAIRVEAGLSFIGLGVSPPTPTWGNMIREGMPYLGSATWLSVFPGLAILCTVLAFNLLGDGLRDIFDPRLRQ